MSTEIRSGVELPARREPVTLLTEDGYRLVGEVALPAEKPPVATLVTLHPLPTAGGFMDSHLLRKASARLPALADLAVLRFNTRGTTSPHGTSEGEFGDGVSERADLAAAMAFVADRGLPAPWLVGWSFGTEVALKWGREQPVVGLILLSPPLRRTTPEELRAWAGDPRPIVALVPEFDDFLRPAEAREKFAPAPAVEVVAVDGAKHLWVGETYTRIALNEIVRRVNPAAYPLPTVWGA
jgi:alpha/beta superfamily hydrolase